VEGTPRNLEAPVLRRGGPGYEQARRAAVPNGRLPDRFPALIVRPRAEQDVVAAVELARREGMKVGIRSGGHSWAASYLRDGGMLIDLSAMTRLEVDVEGRSAAVQPALTGTALNRELRRHGLFFPAGHCTGVGLGGFLLQGGFGWNSRRWGPACMSVEGIEVVTASGELVTADAGQNADLLWAARGAGPGFFGVVTSFQLKLRPRPPVIRVSSQVYPVEVLEELLGWVGEIQSSVSRAMELMVFLRRDLDPRIPGPGAMLLAPVLAESEEEATEAAAVLETCPVIDRAVAREHNVVTEIDELLEKSDDFYRPGWRMVADNMWSSEPVGKLIPVARRVAETLPGAPSHMMWLVWGGSPERPDMAFSMEAETYIALYSVWEEPRQDAPHEAWVAETMREFEPLSAGIQLADENLGVRPAPFMSSDNLRRLEELRRRWDPEGLFHSFMGLPGTAS
jgi:FAD/FMN-containing dehydrogenase